MGVSVGTCSLMDLWLCPPLSFFRSLSKTATEKVGSIQVQRDRQILFPPSTTINTYQYESRGASCGARRNSSSQKRERCKTLTENALSHICEASKAWLQQQGWCNFELETCEGSPAVLPGHRAITSPFDREKTSAAR